MQLLWMQAAVKMEEEGEESLPRNSCQQLQGSYSEYYPVPGSTFLILDSPKTPSYNAPLPLYDFEPKP